VSTINEVSRAIDIRDTLDLFCKERGFKTAWSISSDLKDGIHLQTSAGQTFIPGNFETRQSSEALGRFIDHLGNESSLYQYGNQELIRTVVRDCIATGLIQKDTDMKLSQDVHRTMYCEEDEIAVALQVPVSKIVSVSGAVGFVERSKLSKPVYDMTVRAIPFIEDFVRGQIQLRTVRNLGSDSVSAPVRANRVNESQRGDTFKVLVQPMTPSIPSVHVDVCFKDKAELAAFEQGVRASRLNVETEESQERGFVGVVRILDCSVPQFKDFLESHIRMSLRSAWSGMDERGELG
jgi:hypothetical protein